MSESRKRTLLMVIVIILVFRMYLLGSIEDFSVQNDLAAGDLNLDSVIDALDFAVFKKYLLGVISKLPYSL